MHNMVKISSISTHKTAPLRIRYIFVHILFLYELFYDSGWGWINTDRYVPCDLPPTVIFFLLKDVERHDQNQIIPPAKSGQHFDIQVRG